MKLVGIRGGDLAVPGLKKVLFVAGGILCVSLGLIGIFLPVLPTTPFLLLAAFLFARSSDHALHWLLTNRWFGRYIRNYREGRGLALRDKIITIGLLWLTIGLGLVFATNQAWVRVLLIGIATAVTVHLVRVKTFHQSQDSDFPGNTAELK